MTTTEIAGEHIEDLPGDVIPDQTGTDTADTPVKPPAEVELRHVDPRTLIIGVNTRNLTNAPLPKWFVDDIEDRGVREPIPVRVDGLGRLVVRKGQRRTLAAVKAWEKAEAKDKKPKHELVPVLVEPELITDEDQREIDRIIDQLGENEHRASISDTDEVRATQNLLDLGLSAGQIARKRHIGTKRVNTAVEVAKSAVAVEMLANGTVEDLTHAAVIAEFADDQAAVEALTTAATKRPEQFEHVAQQLRDKLEEKRIRTEIAAQLTEQGVTVIERPTSLETGKIRKLDGLRPTAESASGTELTAEEHKACPGHAAFVASLGSWLAVAKRYGATYVCTDFKANGHTDRYDLRPSNNAVGPRTAEEKAARRIVISNNKAWRSAETVRRKWLKDFLGRKRAPKDGISWVAQMLAEGSHPMRKAMESDHDLAIGLLGMTKPEIAAYHRRDKHVIAAAAANANPTRSTQLMVALVIGAMEKSVGTHTWRGPSAEAKAYFAQLQDWGYPLSDVEMLVLNPDWKASATDVGMNLVDEEPEEDVEQVSEDHGDRVDHDDTEPDEGFEHRASPAPEVADEVAADLAA